MMGGRLPLGLALEIVPNAVSEIAAEPDDASSNGHALSLETA
jgi:hypothetical protein